MKIKARLNTKVVIPMLMFVISAREYGVSRNAKKMLDGRIKYNKPKEW